MDFVTDPRNIGGLNKDREIGRKPVSENYNRKRKQHELNETNVPKDDKSQMKKQEAVMKQTKPSDSNFGPGRPSKLSLDHKGTVDTKLPHWSDPLGVQKKPTTSPQDVSIKYCHEINPFRKVKLSVCILEKKKNLFVQVVENFMFKIQFF